MIQVYLILLRNIVSVTFNKKTLNSEINVGFARELTVSRGLALRASEQGARPSSREEGEQPKVDGILRKFVSTLFYTLGTVGECG